MVGNLKTRRTDERERMRRRGGRREKHRELPEPGGIGTTVEINSFIFWNITDLSNKNI
jgi:hypothetical protein